MGADVIVIGSGYGGLTAAAILAHNGVEVEVMEASGHLGGRAAFDRKDGFLVDYGIHANRFGAEGAAAAAMREIGREIDFAPMGEPQLFMNGKFVALPTGVPQLIRTSMLSVPDRVLMIANLLKLVLANPRKKADVPLGQAIWGKRNEEIRSLVKLLSGIGLVCPDIDNTSTGDFATFLKRALKAKQNVAYPRGGTSQIIEALSQKIEQSGKISLNSRVKSIEMKGGRVKGVKVKDSETKCKAVVSAIPLQKLPEITSPKELPDSLVEKCVSIVPTGGISIDLCLSKSFSDMDGLIVTSDPITMGQFTSNIDPGTAPDGKQLATFYYPLPVELMDDRDAVDAEEAKLRSVIDRMFPTILEGVEWERTLKLKMVDGFEPRAGQTAKDRPVVNVPTISNLFLAGDVVSAPGSGGDVAFASGVEAARQALAFLR